MEAYNDCAVQGTSENTYNSASNVKIAQFIAKLTQAFWAEDVESSQKTGAWYAPNYKVAGIHKLFERVPGNTPETEVTREAMAQILSNLLTYTKGTLNKPTKEEEGRKTGEPIVWRSEERG